MSTAVREAIATAANTVPGISCHPYIVRATEPGTAYVRLDHIEYDGFGNGLRTWNVVLLLPQDPDLTERFLDEYVPAVQQAVSTEIRVTRVQPQRLDIPGVGVLSCVFITGNREE